MTRNSYWVYIATNKSGTLYTGVTNNLERRINEHQNKLIPGFTSKYNINKIIFYQEFSNPNDAIAAEKKIKGWTRRKKILHLISSGGFFGAESIVLTLGKNIQSDDYLAARKNERHCSK